MNFKSGLKRLLDMKSMDNKGLEEWPTASWDGGGYTQQAAVEETLKSDWGMDEMPIIAGVISAEEAGKTIEMMKNAGVSLNDMEQTRHNGLMADQPAIMFKAGSDRQNEMEIDRANGVITALRIRSSKKAKSNKKLSEANESLYKELRSKELQIEKLESKIRSVEELEQENARLVDQYNEMTDVNAHTEEEKQAAIKAADEYKAEAVKYCNNDIKHKELYERAAEENNRLAEEVRKGNEYREDLRRSNGVIDLLLRSYGITGANPGRF